MSKKKPLKVIAVGPDINSIGGIASVLKSHRKAVEGFTYLPTNSRRGTLAGAFVLGLSMLRLPFYRLAGFRAIHVHAASGKSFVRKRLFIRWARLWGFKSIFHSHSGHIIKYIEERGDSVCRFIRSCDAVIVLSESWKRYFEETVGCSRVFVLNNIVELPEREPQRGDTASRPVEMLFIGKICKAKGVYDLVEALAKIKDKIAGRVRVHIAGPGEADELARAVEGAGVKDSVVCEGPVYDGAKKALLEKCDVMLLPSYAEGFPVCLLEAGAYGMASIATNVGGTEELLSDGVNGTIIAPGDIDSLAAAIERYVREPELIERQGLEARRRIAPFLPGAVSASLADIYSRIDS